MIRLFCILVLLSVTASSAHASSTLNLCLEGADYPPYISPDHKGYLFDLTDAAAAKVGMRVIYHLLPWKRCLAMLAHGEMDAALPVSWTVDRAEQFVFPLGRKGNPRVEDRIWLGIYPVFVHRHSAITWDGDSFSGLKTGIGTPLGYVSAERLSALNALAPQSPEPAFGLNLVALGRLDGYVVEEQIGWRSAAASGIRPELRILSQPFLTLPWYVAFSPLYYEQNKALVEKFWRTIGKARAQQFPHLESTDNEIRPK